MTRRAWVELVVLSALWGAVYPLIEIALRDFPPVLVVFGRVLFAALILIPPALHQKTLQVLWRHPRAIIETVLVQATIPLLLLTYGQRYVTASLAAILVGAQPLFVALLAFRYAHGERPQGYKGAIGIGLGLTGLVALFGIDLRGGHLALAGGLFVLVAALCYAAGAIMIHRRHKDAEPLGVAASAMLVTTGTLLIPAAFSLPHHPPNVGSTAALTVLGTICTGATLVMFYTLIARIGPARAALAFYLSPGFAVAFGVTFLREPVSATAVIGLVAIVVGSLLAAQRASEPAPP